MSYDINKIYALIENVVVNKVNSEVFLFGKTKGEVNISKLKNKNRKREYVMCRNLSMYYMFFICKDTLKIPGVTLEWVGSRYGKDHSTVLHAIKTIRNLQETDRNIALIVAYCLNMIMTQIGGENVNSAHPWYSYMFPKYDLY